MTPQELDEIDYGILHLLQMDARHSSPVDMAEQLPVSDTTIRNRIRRLEKWGIIKGYVPLVDYENAGFPLRIEFTCSAPIEDREQVAEAALDLPHVIQVEEMLSARHNIQILVVTNEAEEIHKVTSQINELGLTIERESLLRRLHSQPFNHFGADVVDNESDQ